MRPRAALVLQEAGIKSLWVSNSGTRHTQGTAQCSEHMMLLVEESYSFLHSSMYLNVSRLCCKYM